MDRFSALNAFVKVAETRSFSEAAEKVGLSKSAVSRLVAGLEADLGVRLFHRTTRSIAMTEAGQGYFDRASRILADLEEADLAVSQLQAAPRGRLRVSAPMSFGFLHLAPALPDFLHLYPEVRIDVAMNDRFVDLVEEGFDVAVRIGQLEDSGLIARRLAPVRLAVCASPDYLARRGVPLAPEDLRSHDCLCNSNLAHAHEWKFIRPDGSQVTVSVDGPLTVNNGDSLKAAALGGLGIITLPTFIVGEELSRGSLVSLLEAYLPGQIALHALYPHARHLSPKVRAFVDFLAARFGPIPYWDGGSLKP